MHEKGTSGIDRKDAGLRSLQGGRSPWDLGPNICLQPHNEVLPHSLESLLRALRDGKGHPALEKPIGFVFCSKHKTKCWVLGTSPQAGSEGISYRGISQ